MYPFGKPTERPSLPSLRLAFAGLWRVPRRSPSAATPDPPYRLTPTIDIKTHFQNSGAQRTRQQVQRTVRSPQRTVVRTQGLTLVLARDNTPLHLHCPRVVSEPECGVSFAKSKAVPFPTTSTKKQLCNCRLDPSSRLHSQCTSCKRYARAVRVNGTPKSGESVIRLGAGYELSIASHLSTPSHVAQHQQFVSSTIPAAAALEPPNAAVRALHYTPAYSPPRTAQLRHPQPHQLLPFFLPSILPSALESPLPASPILTLHTSSRVLPGYGARPRRAATRRHCAEFFFLQCTCLTLDPMFLVLMMEIPCIRTHDTVNMHVKQNRTEYRMYPVLPGCEKHAIPHSHSLHAGVPACLSQMVASLLLAGVGVYRGTRVWRDLRCETHHCYVYRCISGLRHDCVLLHAHRCDCQAASVWLRTSPAPSVPDI